MLPILYSFRRCPYAIRARMALCYSGVQCELREVVLRDKAPEFLQASASGTVPTLVLEDQVLDESFDIMRWALDQSDPEGWLEMPEAGYDLVEETDGPFKKALDRTKYARRYPETNNDDHLRTAQEFLKNSTVCSIINTFLQTPQGSPMWQSFPLCANSPSSTKLGLMHRTGRAFIAGWRAILPQIFFLTSCQSIPSGKAGMGKRSFLRRSDAV